MQTIAFFNNKGGVGKTSLVYHLSEMFAELGAKVIAADLDPQANLSTMFLDEERLEELWSEGPHEGTILGPVTPFIKGTGDVGSPRIESAAENIGLVVGDLGLSRFEDKLSDAWPRCMDRDEAAFRVISSFYRILLQSLETREADVALIDVGPNLGAMNRAALIACSHVVIPLAPDLFSLQGLKNLGPTLREWRAQWRDRLARFETHDLKLPEGSMEPVGYVLLQHSERLDRPVKAYRKWIDRIPGVYRESVLDSHRKPVPKVDDDPNCLSLVKHFRSLMVMAMEARKPMFRLKSADGAIGSHAQAVQDCYGVFKRLALRIAESCGVALPRMSAQRTGSKA